jgi:hypothetical protein
MSEARGGAAPGGEGAEPLERRGVENPRIVDLIAADRHSGEVVLSLLEGRPWGGGREQLEQHDAKLDAYFVYVLDGHLARDYPQYKGMPARIDLVCVEEPGEAERPFLAAVARTAVENGLRLVVRIDPDPFARRAPWEGPGEANGSAD